MPKYVFKIAGILTAVMLIGACETLKTKCRYVADTICEGVE